MKKVGYPLFLVMVSLSSAVLFTTITAVTLASYSKAEKSVKEHVTVEGSTVVR